MRIISRRFSIAILPFLLAICPLNASAAKHITLVFKVNEAHLLWHLSGYNTSPAFMHAIANATQLQGQGKSAFLDVFAAQVDKAGQQQLADIFIGLPRFAGLLQPSSTNLQVIQVLKAEFEKEFSHAALVMYKRMEHTDAAHVVNVSKDMAAGTLHAELQQVADVTRAVSILSTRNALDFWETYENAEVLEYLQQVNTAASSNGYENKLWQMLLPNISEEGPYPGPMAGFARAGDTAAINQMLRQHAQLLPAQAVFLWGRNTLSSSSDLIPLYAVKTADDKTPPITALDVAVAEAVVNENSIGTYITLNTSGTAKFENLTEKAAFSTLNGQPVNRCIAITVDYLVYTAPKVMAKISKGKIIITGLQTADEARDMASMLNGGELPLQLQLVKR